MKPVLRILNLEDEPEDTELIKTKLNQDGIAYEMTRVETEKDFVAAITQGGIDVILADLRLPAFDGLLALTIVKEKCPHIPFIFVSGAIGEEMAIETLKLGATDYVLKENLSRLPSSVRRALKESEERTKLMMAEQSLKENELRFRTFFERNNAVMILVEPDSGAIVDANHAACQYYGYTLDRLLTMNIADINQLKPEEVAEARQYIKRGEKSYFIFPHRLASGEVRTVEVHSTPIETQGQMLLFSIIHDITDRERAEQALAKSESKYRFIFENAIEGIFQTSLEGQFISANPAMARMHGYASPEGMIKSITNIGKQMYVHPKDREMYRKILEEQGIVENFEAEVFREDGTRIWTSASSRAVKDASGRILFFEGTVEDITGRKMSEEHLKQTLEKLRKSLAGTIQAMSLTVETRDPYTAGHQRRVSSLATSIAQEMNFSADAVDTIRMAASIHDVGKMSVPAEILSKPGKLTDVEMSLIKVHSETGYKILSDAGLPSPVAEIVLQHHERVDGSGYPQGLKAGEILLEALIIAVADVVEAISSHRPYRPALGVDVALDEIEKSRDILYDSNVVGACHRLFREKGFVFE